MIDTMNISLRLSRFGCITAVAFALTGLNAAAASFQTNSIEGWRVLVNERLLADDKASTEKALGLLRLQLQEIVRVVPTQAVAKLREVKLWFSPEYPACSRVRSTIRRGLAAG